MNVIWNTMVAVYTNVTTYPAITAVFALMGFIWSMMDTTVSVSTNSWRNHIYLCERWKLMIVWDELLPWHTTSVLEQNSLISTYYICTSKYPHNQIWSNKIWFYVVCGNGLFCDLTHSVSRCGWMYLQQWWLSACMCQHHGKLWVPLQGRLFPEWQSTHMHPSLRGWATVFNKPLMAQSTMFTIILNDGYITRSPYILLFPSLDF